MRKIVIGLLTLLAIVAAANALYVTYPAYSAKAEDPRNAAVRMSAYLRAGVDPSTLVVDIWGIEPTASMADVDRSLFDIAAALKTRSFSTVHLAYRGSPRFSFEGSYFRKLGEERAWQNPVYVIRTMPENARKMDGSPAFDTWTGGMIGVVGAQMKDHNEMHRIWYLDDVF